MIALTKTSETSSKISFSWAPVPGAVGYVFFADDKRVSNTWDPSKSSITFSKTVGGRYRVDALGVKDSGAWPQPAPPPGITSPFGYLNYGDKPPAQHVADYKVLIGLPSRPAGATGKTLRYVSSISCSTVTNYGVTYQQANTNGWILSDSQGQLLNSGFPTNYLGDPGSSGYRNAWCANVEQMISGLDGFLADDVQGWVQAISGGRVPTKYPTDQSWYDAIVGFCLFVGNYFKTRGKYAAFNAINRKSGDGGSDTGVRQQAFYTALAPGASGLMNEYWIAHPAIPSPSIRLAGTDAWWKFWDGWRALHPLCSNAGVDFLPLHENLGYLWGLASFLLDWDGQHGAYIWSTSYVGDNDPWDAEHAKAHALGAPTAAAVKSGNTWTRQFQNGRVTVDPVAGTASIT